MKNLLKTALIGAALLASGSLFASNMGFKLVYPLATTAAGVSDGNNWTSLPYFNSFATQDAAGVWADLPVGKQNIYRYNYATGLYQSYRGGGPGQVNFAVTAGEAYNFVVTANVNWTIVGSHNNALAVSLLTTAAGVSDGNNWTAVPYHTTATLAAGIWADLPLAKQNIYRYNPATGLYQSYRGGGPGQVNFPVTIGEAYNIVVTANASWTPAHY